MRGEHSERLSDFFHWQIDAVYAEDGAVQEIVRLVVQGSRHRAKLAANMRVASNVLVSAFDPFLPLATRLQTFAPSAKLCQ